VLPIWLAELVPVVSIGPGIVDVPVCAKAAKAMNVRPKVVVTKNRFMVGFLSRVKLED
jgi:hypothetical protein